MEIASVDSVLARK